MKGILDENLGDYYMDVRQFRNGGIEAVVKTMSPMHEGAVHASVDPNSYANYCKSIGESSDVSSKPRCRRVQAEESSRAENHSRAVRRAKQGIRWCIKDMEADRLLTLTYRENQEDREQVKRDFKRFLQLVRKSDKKWQYVAVLERQERGAYHVHCAVKGWQKVNFLRSSWYKALGGNGHETGENTPGNIDITSPQKARWGTERTGWKSSKLAAYLTKYLSKTFDAETSEKRRYWHSKDTVKPRRERFILCATTFLDAIHEVISIIELHYGHAMDFSRSWVSRGGNCLWLSLGENA